MVAVHIEDSRVRIAVFLCPVASILLCSYVLSLTRTTGWVRKSIIGDADLEEHHQENGFGGKRSRSTSGVDGCCILSSSRSVARSLTTG